MMFRLPAAIAVAALTAACVTAQADTPFSVAHSDAAWDGKTVPERGICTRRGGEGWSPALTFAGIPAGATALELRFTDKDWSGEGAHGIVRVALSGEQVSAGSFALASFKGETDALPAGMTAISAHECGRCGGGVYLGPCSGGREHAYVVNVYALDADAKPLATSELPLGIY